MKKAGDNLFVREKVSLPICFQMITNVSLQYGGCLLNY